MQINVLLAKVSDPMKVLHILYQSLPQISGSSIRSRDLLMSQMEIGMNPVAVTSPFQSSFQDEETINSVRYIRTSVHQKDTISDRQKSTVLRIVRLFKIFSFYRRLKKIILKENPMILHAHAMFFCGIPAILLGKKFNLPVIYEVRSLWMLKKNSGNKGFLDRLIEKLLFSLELYVMRNASMVVAINDNLKDELIDHKITSNRIEVVKNAVNTTLIGELREQAPLSVSRKSHLNFGYIGTLTPHEGIDLLIESFEEVHLKHPQARLLIFGRGIESEKIKELSKKCENIEFRGSIAPESVYKAFDSIDVIVNPRYKNKLTDSVTPLKPLEAMAYEKLFIGSDVGGIKELVKDGFNGFLFEAGNKSDLSAKMLDVLELSQEEAIMVKKNAKEYVFEEKSWVFNAKRYKSLYESIALIHEK